MKTFICFFLFSSLVYGFFNEDYKEPKSVKRFFPNAIPLIKTPSVNGERETFTTQEELYHYIGAIHTKNENSITDMLGPTENNNYLPIIVLSQNKTLDLKNNNNGKPTVMLIAQQHGDEPMGCDVMLGTFKRVTHGDLNYLLKKINIVIIPRVNPDGAEKFTRVARRGVDLNEDHQKLEAVETQWLAKIYDFFKPEVFIDMHEYIADKKSYSNILEDGAVPYYDLLVLTPTNPNYPKRLDEYAKYNLVQLKETLKSSYSCDYYYNPFIKPKNNQPLTLYRATSDKNLARNAYGLKGSLTYLIELRGKGIGFENVARRLNSGLAAVEFLLKKTYENSSEVKELVKIERNNIGNSDKKLELVEVNITLPLINIKTGALENTPALLVKQKN